MAGDLEAGGEITEAERLRPGCDPANMDFQDRIVRVDDINDSWASLDIMQSDGSVRGFIVPTVSPFADSDPIPELDPELD